MVTIKYLGGEVEKNDAEAELIFLIKFTINPRLTHLVI